MKGAGDVIVIATAVQIQLKLALCSDHVCLGSTRCSSAGFPLPRKSPSNQEEKTREVHIKTPWMLKENGFPYSTIIIK